VQQLIGGVGHHPVGRESIEAVLGLPWLGLEPCEAELERESGVTGPLYGGNVSVDARGEGPQDFPGVGCVAAIFLCHVAAVPQPTSVDVALNGGRTDDLGEASLAGALPQLHLKQPILRSDEPLGEKQIVRIARIDMSDSPAVALHAH